MTDLAVDEARLRVGLRAIPRQYEQLAADYPNMTAADADGGGGGRPSPELISSGLMDLLLLRVTRADGVPIVGLEALEGWCRIVIEEREFHWPSPLDGFAGRLTVACMFLHTHTQWIVTQDWSTELHEEVRAIDVALRNALDPYRERIRYRDLLCPGAPGEECGEPLWLDRTYDPVIVCRTGCGATWQPEAWEILAERIQSTVRLADVEAFVHGGRKQLLKWIDMGLLTNHGTPEQPRVKLAEVLDVQRGARKIPA